MNSEAAILHPGKDSFLAEVIQRTSIPPFAPSGKVYFELLESIVSQQLSVRAAATIFSRFCAIFPDNYPHPETLVSIPSEQLRNVGLSFQKANYHDQTV